MTVPVFAGFMILAALTPMSYSDHEYPMYLQQKNVVSGKEDAGNARVIIIGDSRAKAAFDPAQLSDDTYNLALGGTTPVEGYYTLKEYLENHDAPEYLILSYAPMHFEDKDTLWTRSIYFHMINDEDVTDIFKTADKCEDKSELLPDNYVLEWLMYRTYMPNKYAVAMRKSLFSDRAKANKEKYEELVKAKGQSYFGLQDENGGVNGEAKEEEFKASDAITIYMQRIFDLCEENNIKLIVEQTPMNETSLLIISHDYKYAFRDYMIKLNEMKEDALIYEYFYEFPNVWFGDADHLNPEGTAQFCTAIKAKYPEVFN